MENTRVGVAALLIKNHKILLGKRKNTNGHGAWATPGGHLEFGETLEECVRRELLEETGLQADSVRKLWFTNDIHVQTNKHYVTLFMLVEEFSGNLENREPEKCEGWQWFELDNLPRPLFLPLENLIEEEKAFAQDIEPSAINI